MGSSRDPRKHLEIVNRYLCLCCILVTKMYTHRIVSRERTDGPTAMGFVVRTQAHKVDEPIFKDGVVVGWLLNGGRLDHKANQAVILEEEGEEEEERERGGGGGGERERERGGGRERERGAADKQSILT